MMCKKITNRTFLVVADLALGSAAENNSSEITHKESRGGKWSQMPHSPRAN